LEEELAKIDPETLQYLEKLLVENEPALRKIVQNVLDEPISQETEKRLEKPLLPKPFQPTPPPRAKKGEKKEGKQHYTKQENELYSSNDLADN